MSRSRFPRYEGSSAATLAELHDEAMDRLVAEYRAHIHSAGPELDGDEINRISPNSNTTEEITK